MKRYWPIFFLLALLLFQIYVFSWEKQQATTLATHQDSVTPKPVTNLCDTSFLYPPAGVKDQQATTAFLESGDDPSHIRDWYKSQFALTQFTLIADLLSTNNATATYMLTGEKMAQQTTVIIGRGARGKASPIFVHEQCH